MLRLQFWLAFLLFAIVVVSAPLKRSTKEELEAQLHKLKQQAEQLEAQYKLSCTGKNSDITNKKCREWLKEKEEAEDQAWKIQQPLHKMSRAEIEPKLRKWKQEEQDLAQQLAELALMSEERSWLKSRKQVASTLVYSNETVLTELRKAEEKEADKRAERAKRGTKRRLPPIDIYGKRYRPDRVSDESLGESHMDLS